MRMLSPMSYVETLNQIGSSYLTTYRSSNESDGYITSAICYVSSFFHTNHSLAVRLQAYGRPMLQTENDTAKVEAILTFVLEIIGDLPNINGQLFSADALNQVNTLIRHQEKDDKTSRAVIHLSTYQEGTYNPVTSKGTLMTPKEYCAHVRKEISGLFAKLKELEGRESPGMSA